MTGSPEFTDRLASSSTELTFWIETGLKLEVDESTRLASFTTVTPGGPAPGAFRLTHSLTLILHC